MFEINLFQQQIHCSIVDTIFLTLFKKKCIPPYKLESNFFESLTTYSGFCAFDKLIENIKQTRLLLLPVY